MGCCLKSEKLQKISVIKTSNNVNIFTSTADIHKIYSFGKMKGLGVYGKVLVAKQRGNDDKLFAIKVIDRSKIIGKETSLANEIYVLQKLDHPNIIKFYEVYQNSLYFYICTEYCSGGDLLERIPKNQISYSEKQCQLFALKILTAIGYIHEQGIIHRDIKPENIMLSKKDLSSEPKIIDFGLAVKLEQAQISNYINCVGTPLYVAPEVIEGYYSDKCDIWSFGVMLFQLLCGYPPYYGSNKKELFQHILNQELIFERRHWNNISKYAKDFLKQLLTKNPFLRPKAKDCLKHQWFTISFDGVQQQQHKLRRSQTRGHSLKKVTPEDLFEDQRSIYEILKNYQNGAKFKKEVMKVLINQMNENELEHFTLLKYFDFKNLNYITKENIQEAFARHGRAFSDEKINQMIYEIDPNHDCKISYEEFCQMMIQEGLSSLIDFQDQFKEEHEQGQQKEVTNIVQNQNLPDLIQIV